MNASALKDKMRERGQTQKSLAAAIGVSENTFSAKMIGRGSFTLSEVDTISGVLHISDPLEAAQIFLQPAKQNAEILSAKYSKLTVLDLEQGEEVAVITNDSITTAGDHIVVKLTPRDC